ncbi:MAG: cyclic nucleotide-binding domain-containing protein, partial [Thermoflexales bacterium]|nr:cyclic nucleotide-binding domain-containing protein [Thermoflexales bacterium]
MDTGQELFGSVYAKGDVIFRQGEVGEEMYIIQSGAVQVSRQQGGRETVIAIREQGDFIGEMALFEKERRFATVTALCPTRLLPMTGTSLLEKMQRDPGVALHFIKGLVARIQEADRQVHKTVEGDEILRWLATLSRQASRKAVKEAAEGDEPGAPSPDMAALQVPDQAEKDGAPLRNDAPFRELADGWRLEGEAKCFEPGESIFLEGVPGDAMYIVLSGSVEITQGAGQDRWVLGRVSPGEFFGEWALIADSPRSDSATAVSRTQLMPIKREEFAERISARPEIAMYIIQGLSSKLRRVSTILVNPRASIQAVQQIWQPLIRRHKPIKISIVSLATCAGCSAVLLDDEILAQVLELADILYCPMLIDQDRIQEADVALVDGAVRLKEDQEKLEEARIKSRFVAAWGTCASFGGIPAEANRFEIEELVEETFGHTADTFAYYLSGKQGVEQMTFQDRGLALLRKAYRLDDFVRVDYYVPGCPPAPALLLQLVGELSG